MKKIIFLFVGILLFLPQISFARENVTDWYIKNFDTEIVVNKDSSLLITEEITADCGNLPNKHGIFRILPTQTKTPDKTYDNPIKLISITDFDNNPLKYSTTKDSNTITWKIGDPNVTVTGENYYKIVYRVENVTRFMDANSDELYWNLNGNFWDLEIDNFQANIIFPEGITQNNTQVWYYTGYLNEKGTDLARYNWTNINILSFYSTQTLLARQGITVSVALPKNVFTPHQPSLLEKIKRLILGFSTFLIYFLPVIVFIICFLIWRKYGKDPKINKTVIPEFEIPENLRPMKMGMLMKNAAFDNKFISASIINLAVNGFISIEEAKKEFILFKRNIFKDQNFKLTKLKEEDESLDVNEKLLFRNIFDFGPSILISSLGTIINFKKNLRIAKYDLIKNELISRWGLVYKHIFIFIGIFVDISLVSFFRIGFIKTYIDIIFILTSGLIFIFFGLLMPKRTLKGAELNWRIKGFKLYMETAEKYRQQFNEKENIFEKFLPYAIVFGMAKEWAKKMEQIYGQNYFTNYHPIWFVGTSFASFDVNSLVSSINNISQSVSSHVGGSSGFGGGGGAGGGGGGGGGGGW